MLASKRSQDLIRERRELEAQAIPLYKEMLSSVPFYQEVMHDDHFWRQYVASRVVAARGMVERQKAASG